MTDTAPGDTGVRPKGTSREWNYHPDIPIQNAPFFDVPPKPAAALKWLLATWARLSPPVSHLAFAVLAYWLFFPSTQAIAAGGIGWMAQILAINLGAVLMLAGGLHAYFYTFARQDTHTKFDIRPMERNSRRFTFNDQVYDNMFWTLASGVPIWTVLQIGYFAAAAHGAAPVTDSFWDSPVWFVLLFFVLRFWQSFHFYWIHRLIHYPPLFKRVHHLHHRNVNVGPWSGLSMHPVEHLLYYSAIVIFFVLPAHPVHVLYLMFALNLGAVYSHSGFDALRLKGNDTALAGSFFHQLHHRYFECNYGTEEIPLDRWFGSFHDGSRDATMRIRERKKRMMRK